MSTVDLALNHLVRPPETTPEPGMKPPVLFLLHGVGSNEEDLFSLTPFLDERFLVISPRGPYTLNPGQYAWWHVAFRPDGIQRNADEVDGSRSLLIQFIDEVVKAYDADPQRVYLMGFSQGAIMSLAVMLTAPQVLAGVVAMSGMLAHDVLPKAAPPEQLQDFPILVVHGIYDDVLPIAEARALRQYLAQLPVKLDYREYPMRHQISDESLDDVCGWLIDRLNR